VVNPQAVVPSARNHSDFRGGVEGNTRPGFSEYLRVQNPGDAQANVHAEYMSSGPVNYFQDFSVEARIS
jgi:hypothetical protein